MWRLCFLISVFFSVFVPAFASAHEEVSPSSFGFLEGDLIRASDTTDPDIYIVSQWGYKRLFLNPAIFGFYGHLRWENIKLVTSEARDAFPTSGLFRDCEANDPKVYALEVSGEDAGAFHWVNVTAERAMADDHDFFEKVFCINAREFGWYLKSAAYSALTQIPSYARANLPPPGLNETNMPLTVADGFRVSLFTPTQIGPLRFLAFSPDGILFASMPSSVGLYGFGSESKNDGKIFALPDQNRDGKVDEVRAVISGLDLPHGLAFYNNYLYVAEEGTVARYLYLGNGTVGAREVVVPDLPSGGAHISRTLGFSLAGKMYVAVGSTCNACVETDPRRAVILEYNADGTGGRVFASGLRNAVGFVFNPTTAELWATDNGRDYLGDELPPDEINIVREGKDYGWPYCYGQNAHDTEFDKNFYIAIYPPLPCGDAANPIKEPSLFDLQAHSAPLGLRFVQSAQFPQAWQGDLLVAYHGSWNRSEPTGYKVARFDIEGNTVLGGQDFISGWLMPDGAKVGRPVDLIFDPSDGSLYISDDKAKIIYRVTKIEG